MIIISHVLYSHSRGLPRLSTTAFIVGAVSESQPTESFQVDWPCYCSVGASFSVTPMEARLYHRTTFPSSSMTRG
jgi:hypothetical protein